MKCSGNIQSAVKFAALKERTPADLSATPFHFSDQLTAGSAKSSTGGWIVPDELDRFLHHTEWDFLQIPHGERYVAMPFEYVRESPLLRQVVRQHINAINPITSGARKEKRALTNLEQLEIIKQVGALWPIVVMFAHTELYKDLKTPWLKLEVPHRATRLHSYLGKKFVGIPDDRFDQMIIRAGAILESPLNVETCKSMSDQGKFPSTFGAMPLMINWDRSDRDLQGAFANWLAANRHGRGKAKRTGVNDADHYLKILAIKRLIEKVGLEDAMTHTEGWEWC